VNRDTEEELERKKEEVIKYDLSKEAQDFGDIIKEES
jgi:hypothetical protein